MIPPIPILEVIEGQNPNRAPSLIALPALFTHEDTLLGADAPLAVGDRATVSFRVGDGKAKEVADTDRRGLSYTFVIGGGKERLLDLVVVGMRVGGERLASFSPADVYGKGAVPRVLPAVENLQVRVRVLSAVRIQAASPTTSVKPPGAEKGQR